MVSVTGAVYSRTEGYTNVIALLPAFAFHAITSAVGLQLFAGRRKAQ